MRGPRGQQVPRFDPFLLSEPHMRPSKPHLPLPYGRVRFDDRRVLSGIAFVIRHGLLWRNPPLAYGSHSTLRIRFVV